MTRRLPGVILIVLVLAAPTGAQSGYQLLQQALSKEQAEGNLSEAIAMYQRIVKQFASDRLLVAKALLQLGEAYQKLGDRQAQQAFERIVREFADQKDVVAQARARLEAWKPRGPVPTGRTVRQIWIGPEVDSMGAVSSDGRYLSFTDWLTGDLALRDLTTATNRRLTNTGGWDASGDFAEFSVVSPDGRQVAYAWFTEKSPVRGSFYDLRLLPTAGVPAAKPRILHPRNGITWIAPLAWTPDGQSVAVVRELGDGTQHDLALVSIVTGAVRSLKQLPSRPGQLKSSVSPDGRFLAYDFPEASASASRDIFMLPLDGSQEWPIIQAPSNEASPLWSPDGKHLLFFSDRTGRVALWSVRVEDGKPQGRPEHLSSNVERVSLGITRAGSLYYTAGTGRRNLYLVELDPQLNVKGSPALFTERFLHSNTAGAWSPNRDAVAFYSLRGSPALPGSTVLVIRSIRTERERDVALPDIVVPSQPGVGLRWFPDGESVLVVSRPPQRNGYDYYKVEIATGRRQLLRHVEGAGMGSIQPDLSPDGRFIYFIERGVQTDKGPANRLLRRNLDTAEELQLKTGWFGSLALSADGRQLAYLGHDVGADDRFNEVAVMPADGGQARVLFRGASWYDASRFGTLGWSRDQRFVFFVKPDNPAAGGPDVLWRVPVDGGAAARTGLELKARIKVPGMHPDGTKLLLSVQDVNPGEVWVLENFLPAAPVR